MMMLDKRQRAMLDEMGVRVWQPAPETAAPLTSVTPPKLPKSATPVSSAENSEVAIDSGADYALSHSAAASFDTQKQPAQAERNGNGDSDSSPAWRVGAAQTLYADTALNTAARWLVLLEAPASALQDFNPTSGDAGKLLDNMLRAANLHMAGAVLLAPLVRTGTGGDLPSALKTLLGSAKADVVLVMGRLAAQALLQSAEPLAKLRGQIHDVQGQKVVITIDPAYLLRNPLDKAKAWDDLCLAIGHVNTISTS